MKKLFYFLATASVLAVACAKEEAVKENANENKTSGTVTLTASMPEFINAETKASVSDAGVFAWDDTADAEDIIDVVYAKAGSEDVKVQFKCTDASEGSFTNVDVIPAGYSLKTDGNVAFYPHGYNGTPSDQTFESPALAAKGFQMHATYSAGKLAFVHDNAILKITVNDNPDFAKQIIANYAKVNLSLTKKENTVVYIPVAPSNTKMTLSVMDATSDANTIICKVTKNTVNVLAANFYVIPDLNVGTIIKVKDDGSKGKHHLSVWLEPFVKEKSQIFYDNGSYPFRLNSKDGYLYVVLNTYNWTWAEKNKLVGVSFEDNEGDASRIGTTIYLRDITLTTVTDKDYFSAPYRIYWGNKNDNWSPYCYAWYTEGTEQRPLGTWPGTAMTQYAYASTYYYCDLAEGLSGKSINYKFSNNGSPETSNFSFDVKNDIAQGNF